MLVLNENVKWKISTIVRQKKLFGQTSNILKEKVLTFDFIYAPT